MDKLINEDLLHVIKRLVWEIEYQLRWENTDEMKANIHQLMLLLAETEFKLLTEKKGNN